jgi:hypothetical protein
VEDERAHRRAAAKGPEGGAPQPLGRAFSCAGERLNPGPKPRSWTCRKACSSRRKRQWYCGRTDRGAAGLSALGEQPLRSSGPALFFFDAGYDAVGLTQALGDYPAQILVRLNSRRCFYADPPQRPTGRMDARGDTGTGSSARSFGTTSPCYVREELPGNRFAVPEKAAVRAILGQRRQPQ